MRKILFLALGLVSLSTYAQTGKVGINTTEPKATLDVNGNQILGKADYTDSKEVSTVVRDNKTGELKLAGKAGVQPINIITFTLAHPDGDWVNWYNTKIPKDKYTVAVIGSTLYDSNNPNGLTLKSLKPGYYNPFNVYANDKANLTDGSTNEWYLHADYLGGAPVNSSNKDSKINAVWKITCLVISNSLVNVLPEISEEFNGGTELEAQNKPFGL